MVIIKKKYKLMLFRAGSEHNSEIAEINIRKYLNRNEIEENILKIINIEEQPDLALKHNVFLTPALLIIDKDREHIIFGDLSDSNKLQQILREYK